ncbi:hypothetical protein M407DRAFT_23088 [Tulasnella calospora MUT 4182]|uniref:LisH domain-containing protein n=1 Tax=Tulasnella calospora MUT 4182 TaxID=1051891 RepID=A0A0C3M1Q7_9AGAM|nr:hypothetical protein M407DRAFT_23088 [Tulasnella calospora MUT 4182]
MHHPESSGIGGGGEGEVLVDSAIAVHDATTPSDTLSSSSSSGVPPTTTSQPPPFLPPLFLPTPSPLSSNGFTAPPPQSSLSQPQPATNGFSKGKETNGFANNAISSSSASPAPSASRGVSRVYLPGNTVYEDSNIDREEFVRLAIQIFKDIGYSETASTLEAESGYSLEAPLVAEFRQAVLSGEWTKVSDMLPSLGVGCKIPRQPATLPRTPGTAFNESSA